MTGRDVSACARIPDLGRSDTSVDSTLENGRSTPGGLGIHHADVVYVAFPARSARRLAASVALPGTRTSGTSPRDRGRESTMPPGEGHTHGLAHAVNMRVVKQRALGSIAMLYFPARGAASRVARPGDVEPCAGVRQRTPGLSKMEGALLAMVYR